MNPQQFQPLRDYLSGLTEEQLKAVSESHEIKKVILRSYVPNLNDLNVKNEEIKGKILEMSTKYEKIKHNQNIEQQNSLNNQENHLIEDIKFLKSEIEKNTTNNKKQQLLDILDNKAGDLKSKIDKNNTSRVDVTEKFLNNESLSLQYRRLTVLSNLIKSGAQVV